MKVALINYDKVKEKSFYVKNGRAFRVDDDSPYLAPGGIENKIFRNIWNIPFVFDGYHVNYNEGLPALDFDVIFAVAEDGYRKNSHYSVCKKVKKKTKLFFKSKKSFINKLRSKYKNAVIIGYSKEICPALYYDDELIKFLNMCDKAAIPFRQEVIDLIQDKVNKKVHSFYYPYNIELIRGLFLNKKKQEKVIFVGASKNIEIIGGQNIPRGYEASAAFAEYLAKKYNYAVLKREDKLSWSSWLEHVNKSMVCINLDPTPKFGQVAIDCAILETPHLGGNLDAAVNLFPQAATNDLERLEEIFMEIINKDKLKADFALNKVKEMYSFDAARNTLDVILKD